MTTVGLNISGGEWSGTSGTHDMEYHYPDLVELTHYANKGVDFVRLPIAWERVQGVLGGELDLGGDIALIKQVLDDAASLGIDVIIDVHNYGRYDGITIGSSGGPTIAQFADFWKKMAVELKDYSSLVGYDLMNEPNGMPAAGVWKAAAQSATDAIRTVDMNNVIYVQGDGWSSAHTWLDGNSDFIINDPADRIVYEAHGYYDHWNEGAYRTSYEDDGAYPMIGVDRLMPFVEWLKANNLKGMIGEFGVPSNDPRWLEVQKNALDYMVANGVEATAWGGGAWFNPDYTLYTAKPGEPDSAYMNLLEQYFSDYTDPFADGGPPPPPQSGAPLVVINDVTASELDAALIFTLTRSGDLSLASTVNYATGNSTASAGLDFDPTSGVVSFAAGQATATVSVHIIDDPAAESPEILFLNLFGGTNITIKDGQGVGTINSEDTTTGYTPPRGYPSSATIVGTDGNDGINADPSRVDYVDAKGGDDFITGAGGQDYIDGGAGTDTISYHWAGAYVDVDLLRWMQQNADANGDILVNIENINGSGHGDQLRGNDVDNVINGLGGQDILAGRGGSDTFVFNSAADANNDVITDYSAADVLDFSAFNPKFLSITNDGVNTRIVGDSNNDGVGDFGVTLNGVHTSVNGVTVAGQPPAPPAAPAVAINDVSVDERAGTMAFTVSRSGLLTSPSTVNFATANGSAMAGSDYTAISGTIRFAAGETTKTVTVAIINDALVESLETFTVNFSGGTNVTISDAQGIGTITSDDVAPPPTPVAPSVSVNDVTVNEGDGAMQFTITRSGDLSLVSSINYATANGTAAAGSDYAALSGTVRFAAGETAKTVTIGVINDSLVENSETLMLTLSGGTNVIIGRSQAAGTIVDNDQVVAPPASGLVINGTGKADALQGTAGNDTINGRGGRDVLNGGSGADTLTGAAGNDRFVFDSAPGAHGDKVTDFKSGIDTLDLSRIDANSVLSGDQAFKWLDFGTFTGAGGELREYLDGGHHYVAGDIDGNGLAEFVIEVAGTNNLAFSDFVL